MKNKLDLSKAPYRGIYTEIALEQNTSPQNIRQAIVKYKNPRIIQELKKKIEERKSAVDYLEATVSVN